MSANLANEVCLFTENHVSPWTIASDDGGSVVSRPVHEVLL